MLVRRIFLIVACFSPAIYPVAAMAECTWPGKDGIPPVQVPPPGSTVTCTGDDTNVFVSGSDGITVEVTDGASIGGIELLTGATTVINRGAVRDDAPFRGFGVSQYGDSSVFTNYGEIAPGVTFFGSEYRARNFGTITSSLEGGEFSPTGAIFSPQTEHGLIRNEVSTDGIGVIESTGDYSAGIIIRDPTGTPSIANLALVASDTLVAQALIHTSGLGSPGVSITNDAGDAEASIFNRGIIRTLGGESAAISVFPIDEEISFGSVISVENQSYGSLTTNGVDSQGILAYAGTVDVRNAGNIVTRGSDSAGIDAIGLTSVSVQNQFGARIDTEGPTFSPGIVVLGVAPTGSPYTALNEGAISTLGADSPGIIALGGLQSVGNVCFTEPGCRSTITTEFDGSAGIQLGLVAPGFGVNLPSENGSAYNTGSISTQGAFAAGIDVLGRENEIINHSDGEILTIGMASPGITARDDRPGEIGDAANEVSNFGAIETRGFSSSGISVAGQRSQVINVDDIETTGIGSYGIDLSGRYSTAENFGLIRTSGERANGMNLDTREGSMTNSGSIETIGIDAHGVLYDTDPVAVLNDITSSGDIVTDGAGAVGIYALNSTFVIDNSGGISTSGANADGIRVRTLDLTDSLDIPAKITNRGEIFVSGAGSIGVRLETKLLEDTEFENTVTGRVTSSGVAVAGGESFDQVANRGIIDGDIQLGGAVDQLINDGVINGNVQLGTENDEFFRGALSAVDGMVDGGEDDDTLTLLTVSGNEVVDGSKFVNFENANVAGAGGLTLTGDMSVDSTTVNGVTLYVAGRLDSAIAAIDGGGVQVLDGGVLAGNGTVGSDVDVQADGGINPGASIGGLTIEDDLLLNGGFLTFEADGPSAIDQLVVGGDVVLNDGIIEVILGFTPDTQDVLQVMLIGQALQISSGFGGIVGVAAANSGVPIGTEFLVGLGDDVFQATVTSMIPIPPAIYFFVSALFALMTVGRKKAA